MKNSSLGFVCLDLTSSRGLLTVGVVRLRHGVETVIPLTGSHKTVPSRLCKIEKLAFRFIRFTVVTELF